jgi:hypothetical protein
LRITEPSLKGKPDATTAVCLAFRVRLVSQVSQENQENLVFQELLACPVVHHWKFARKFHHHHANHAHQDHRAQSAHLASPEILAPTAHQATLAKTAATAHQDHQVLMVHLANQAKTEKKDQPEIQLSVLHQLQANQDQQAKMDHQDRQVKTANLAQMVRQDPQETKDHQALLDLQETMVLQVIKARQDRMGQKENRVFVRNTAPRTVVFSSKMEQGDKRFKGINSINYEINEKPVPLMSICLICLRLFLFRDQKIQKIL